MYAIIATGGKQYKVSEGDVINVAGKGKKINIFTYKAKKNIRKRQGHRQPYTQLKILNIKA